MKKQLFLLFLCCISLISIQAQTITWTGAESDLYNNANNWSPAQVPTATNDVIIPTGSTMIINASASVKSIVVQGTSTITINQNLSFNDASSFSSNTTVNWNNSSLYGGGILTNNGTVNLTTGNSRYISGATTIINNGLFTMPNGGYLRLYNTAVFNNTESGIFDIQSDATITYSGSEAHNFINSGLLKKTTSTGNSNISSYLYNTGTIEVESGTLTMNNKDKTFDGGIYNVSSGSQLILGAQIYVSGTLNGLLDGPITWINDVNVPITATFDFTGGEQVNWNSGDLLGGGVLTNESEIDLSTNGSRYIKFGTTLKNNGLFTMPGGGYLYLYHTSIFNNTENGVFDIQSDATVTYSGSEAHNFINSGLLKKTTSTGNSNISSYFNNTGTIEVESGTLTMNYKDKNFDGGIYNVSSGSQLILGAPIYVSGTLNGLLDGPITWINDVNVPTTATFDFTGSEQVNWNSGSLLGGGILINASRIDLNTNGSRYIESGTTLKNNELFTMPAGGYLYLYNNSIFNNAENGVFDIQSDATITYSGTEAHNFKNVGLLKKTEGEGNANFSSYLTNTGTIIVESGTLTMNYQTKTFEGGEYNVSEDSQLILGTQINVSETLTGELNGAITWKNNISVADAAAFDFTGDTQVNWNSGSLIGGGTLTNVSTVNLNTSGNRYISGETTLTNNGLVTMPAGGYLSLYDTSILNNTENGVFDIQSVATITYSGSEAHNFINSGILKKTMNTGNSNISANFTNTGTINVESGTLTMNNKNKTFDGGIYNVSTDTQLILGTEINASQILTGELDGPITWTNKISVIDTATFNFTGDTGVNWNSGSLFGGGVLTNASTINLSTNGSRYISGTVTTLANTGVITLPAGGNLYLYDDTTLDNQPSGVIDFQSDCVISYSGNGSFNIANEGIIKKTAGNGVTQIYPPVTNAGIIDVISGELEFSDAFGLQNTVDGIIKGTATIDLPVTANFTNDGTFAPGASPGILTVLGTYKSSSSSVLDVDLDGLVQGTEYDLLEITGTDAIFEGIVNVNLGFDANIGDSFTIATVSGEIATKNLTSPIYSVYGCKQLTFEVTYPNDNAVVLTVSDKGDVLPPEVITQDITVQLDASGNVSITPLQIDNGSSDGCTISENLIFELDKTEFTCADIGENTVTLTVTDEAGNFASDSAIVTVEDDLAPIVSVQNISIDLDASGSATITAGDIDNGTTDNCMISALSIDVDNFSCSDIGENTVVFTAEDQSGNSATESVTVTVSDPLSACAEGPVNNDCVDATPISCGESVEGTTIGATQSGMANPSCAGGTPADVFYSLDVQEGNEYTINVVGVDYDGVLVLYSGSCGSLNEIDCADDGFSAGIGESITFIAATTETVVIRTYDWSSSAGSFTMSVDCPVAPDCTPPELSLEVQDGNGEPITDCIEENSEYYVMVSISGGTGNASYTLSDSNGTEWEANFTSTHTAGPYNAEDSVSFTVEGNDDNSCSVNSVVVNPDICVVEPCENPIVNVSAVDADGEAIDCVEEDGKYHVWIELTGGSGNDSYTVYDDSGEVLTSNLSAEGTYLAGPYNEGVAVSFTVEGNDDDECSVVTDTVDPDVCITEPEPCEDPYNENAATSEVYISNIQMAGIGVDIGNPDYDFHYTSNQMVTDGYEEITNPQLTIYPGLQSAYTVSSGPAGNSNPYYYTVWIDLNQDGCFDADERIIWSPGGVVNGQIGTVDVPYTFAIFAPGTYQARIRNSMVGHPTADSNGDGEALDFTIQVITEAEAENVLGVESQVFTDFNYYPNPVENQLNLRAGSLIEQVEVYNLLGQKVIQEQPNALEVQMDTDRLQSGVYLMKVTIDGNQKTFRVVKN